MIPWPEAAKPLLPFSLDRQDGAHDMAHLWRVWCNARAIAADEGGDLEILLAAVLLHDCVWVDKGSDQRPMASRLAAQRAAQVLGRQDWPSDRIARVAHAIEAHSFSARITPLTLEAKVLQDGDRLDALGLIGAARCLWIAGARGVAILDPVDPGAEARALDDAAYALDHFKVKLFTLGEGFQTETGRKMAKARMDRLRGFYDGLIAEVQPPIP